MEGALTLSWRDMGRTAGILCAASLVGLLFYKAGITEANIVTVYLLAVLCTALATDGRVYGISAAVASVLVFNYLFTVPRFTLKFNDVSRYSVTFLVMFIAACITSTLTMRVKTQARQAARKAHRSEVLLETSQALQRAEGEQQIFTAAAEHLSRLLRAGVSLYPVRDGALQPPLVATRKGRRPRPVQRNGSCVPPGPCCAAAARRGPVRPPARMRNACIWPWVRLFRRWPWRGLPCGRDTFRMILTET